MNFLRLLIKIPLLIIVIVFAVINNDFATFNLKPFNLNITVSLSVLILVLFFGGYLLGRLDSFVAHAPIRKQLRAQKKTNKVLNKEQEKLHETVSTLKEDLEHLKHKEEASSPKLPLRQKMANFFSFKKQ